MSEPSRHGVTRTEFVSRSGREGLGYKAAARVFWGHIQATDPGEWKRCVTTAKNWARWAREQGPQAPDDAAEQLRSVLARHGELAAPARRELPEVEPEDWDPTSCTREEYLERRIAETRIFMRQCMAISQTNAVPAAMRQLDELRRELEQERESKDAAVDPLEARNDAELVTMAAELVAKLPDVLREPIEEVVDAVREGQVLQLHGRDA